MNIDNLIKILQASIAPCVLISGIGLLLLSMTNRLARPIDRIHVLINKLGSVPSGTVPLLHAQIRILYKRCRLLQLAIALMTISIFLTSVIILMLFSTYVFRFSLEPLIKFLFSGALISIILSLLLFFYDICLSLSSLKMEVGQYVSD